MYYFLEDVITEAPRYQVQINWNQVKWIKKSINQLRKCKAISSQKHYKVIFYQSWKDPTLVGLNETCDYTFYNKNKKAKQILSTSTKRLVTQKERDRRNSYNITHHNIRIRWWAGVCWKSTVTTYYLLYVIWIWIFIQDWFKTAPLFGMSHRE